MTKSAQPSSTGNNSAYPLAEFDLVESGLGRSPSGLGDHLIGHVDADNAARRSDKTTGDEAVETRPRPDIDDVAALADSTKAKRIAGPGERFDRHLGDAL